MTEVQQQLAVLVGKLKGKSVYTSLKRISEGKCDNKVSEVIGISSLLTHSLIEMKRNPDYKKLVDNMYLKLGELINNLDGGKK